MVQVEYPFVESPQPGNIFQSPALRSLIRNRMGLIGLCLVLVFTAIALIGPFIAPHDPTHIYFGQQYLPPAWVQQPVRTGDPAFLLGTDSEGRDVLSRLLYGTRTSIFMALSAVPLAALIGVTLGLIAGYAGGRVDNWIMRIVDVFYSIPPIMFMILAVFILRETFLAEWLNGVFILVLGFALVGWVSMTRLIRAAILSLKEDLFVEAARSIGASRKRIIVRHLLPNCLSLVVVWMSFAIPRMVIAEAILGYLNIAVTKAVAGAEFYVTSWGGLFLSGRTSIHAHPTLLLAPTLCVMLVAIGFTFLGDALRDALDPRMRNLSKG